MKKGHEFMKSPVLRQLGWILRLTGSKASNWVSESFGHRHPFHSGVPAVLLTGLGGEEGDGLSITWIP